MQSDRSGLCASATAAAAAAVVDVAIIVIVRVVCKIPLAPSQPHLQRIAFSWRVPKLKNERINKKEEEK